MILQKMKKTVKQKTKASSRDIKCSRLLDKVTVVNLDIALRICNIHLHKTLIDRIIDLTELIGEKGDDTTIKDICKLQSEWLKTNPFRNH